MKLPGKYSIERILLTSLILLVLGFLGWSLGWPMAAPSQLTATASLPAFPVQDIETPDSKPPVLADFNPWQRRLQSWAAPGTASPEMESQLSTSSSEPMSSEPSSQGIQLVGTIIEAGNSFAMFIDDQGAIDLQPAGGILQLAPSGTRVDWIASHSATISRDGRTQRLVLVETRSLDRQLNSTGADAVDDTVDHATAEEIADVGTADAAATMAPANAEMGDARELSLADELDWLNGSPAPKMTAPASPPAVPGVQP